MNKKIFARIISVTLVIGVILATCLTLFACDKNKKITVEDVFKSSNSKSEFSSYKLEISLPAGWSVYTSSGTGSQSASHNSDVGYIESINAFVVQKNGVLSIVKMNDEKIYFDGGIKGMIFPEWIGVSAVRVKDGLVLCKFASGEAGVLTVNGETVISRTKIGSSDPTSSKSLANVNIDNAVKVLDGGLVAVAAQYDTKGKTGYTSIYRPTTSGVLSERGALVCRVKNSDNKLSYVKGFDSKYVTVVGNKAGDEIFAIPQTANAVVPNLDSTTNGTVSTNNNKNYSSEITYIGGGRFFIHEDWTVENTEEYSYYDGFNYYVFRRRIYTPDNDVTREYTANADKVFLYLENKYYSGDKGGINTASYLKEGYTYASYGLTIIGKVGFYDQFILDENLNVVMSLTGNYGITIKDQKKEKVGYFDLIMQCVDGYYYVPLHPSEVNVYDKAGNLVGHNDRSAVLQQELSNNMIVAAITDPQDSKQTLYGAFNLYGQEVVPFEYLSLSAFRGSYTIGQKLDANKVKKYYIVGADGKTVDRMSDGSEPLKDMAYVEKSNEGIYKIGCYMYFVKQKDENGKDVTRYGIKNFNPNVQKNIVMPATMASGCTLYAPSSSPSNVFVFDKITTGADVSYNVYRLI